MGPTRSTHWTCNLAAKLLALPHAARRLLRFRLRTLFIATTVIGVALGVHVRRKRFDHDLAERIRPFGGLIFYDYQVDARERLRVGAPSPVPRWLAKFVGDDFFSRPAHLSLGTPEADDSILRLIGKCTSLRVLQLNCRRVTSAGLAELGSLRRLRHLSLNGTPLDDESIKIVVGMKQLRVLSLERSRITDRAVPYLRRCTSLTRLDIQKTAISRVGSESLKQALPDSAIYWSHADLDEIDELVNSGCLPCEIILRSRNAAPPAH